MLTNTVSSNRVMPLRSAIPNIEITNHSLFSAVLEYSQSIVSVFQCKHLGR